MFAPSASQLQATTSLGNNANRSRVTFRNSSQALTSQQSLVSPIRCLLMIYVPNVMDTSSKVATMIPVTEGPRGRGRGAVVASRGRVRGGCGVKVAVRG
jgi:hypothetical protein